MEDQLINLGFVKFPDEVINVPFRKYFAYHYTGGLLEVTLKNGKIYTSEKVSVGFDTFIEKFKKEYGNNKS